MRYNRNKNNKRRVPKWRQRLWGTNKENH